jgi:hypothetical protein
MRTLATAGLIAVAAGFLSGCNSDPQTGAYTPPVTAPNLPVTAAFATTSSLTPASSGTAALTVPLPPSSDYSGQAVFPLAAIPAGLDLTTTYTNRVPAGVSALGALRQNASAARTPLDALSTDVVYACFAANYTVTLNGAPNFAFVLPLDFATRLVAYNLALAQNGRWVGGYGGPGNVVTDGKSATVLVSGRFGFTIPAGGTICVAL